MICVVFPWRVLNFHPRDQRLTRRLVSRCAWFFFFYFHRYFRHLLNTGKLLNRSAPLSPPQYHLMSLLRPQNWKQLQHTFCKLTWKLGTAAAALLTQTHLTAGNYKPASSTIHKNNKHQARTVVKDSQCTHPVCGYMLMSVPIMYQFHVSWERCRNVGSCISSWSFCFYPSWDFHSLSVREEGREKMALRTWGLVVSSGYQLLRNYESCRLDGGFAESVPQLSQVQVLMPRLHNTRGEVCYSSCPSSPLPLDCECVADLVSNRPGN